MNKANINLKTGKQILMTVIISLLLSLMPQVAAKAENEGTLKIHKLSSVGVTADQKDSSKTYYPKDDGLFYEYLAGAEYTVYQIGTFEQVTLNGEVSIKYKPIEGLNLATIDASTKASDIDVSTATNLGTFGPTISSESLEITSALNKNGIYLIKETEKPTGVSVGNDFIITVPMYDETNKTWNYDVEVFPKNVVNIPYIEKTITTGADVDVDDSNVFYANVGDTITYTVSVTAPADMDKPYSTFQIIDSSSTNLSILTNTISVSGKSYSNGSPYTLVLTDDYTVDYDSNGKLVISLTPDGIAQVGSKDSLTVTYNATITGPINTSTGGLVNSVELKTDDDLIKPDPDVDPDPVVYIYSYGIKKVDENSNALGGAKFVLAKEKDGVYTYLEYDKDSSTWKDAASKDDATSFETSTVGSGTESEAILQFINLDNDIEYYLFEVSAPGDYQVLVDPIKIKAAQDTTQAVYASYDLDGVYQTGVAGSIGYTTTIKNVLNSDYPGSLPSTGGNGVYIFTIIGAALIIFAIVLLVRSKKNKKSTD